MYKTNLQQHRIPLKRFIVTLGVLACLGLSARAQLIITESDTDHARRRVMDEAPFIPDLGVTHDQYAPLADGVLLLCGLGLLYRRKKAEMEKGRKKQKNNIASKKRR